MEKGEKIKNEIVVNRGEKDKKRVNKYDLAMYRFVFRSNRDLYLSGLRFFGLPEKSKEEEFYGLPKESEEDSADVRLYLHVSTLLESMDYKSEKLFPEKQFRITLSKEKLTTVELPRPVKINANVWIEIGFVLDRYNLDPNNDGPATETLEREATLKRFVFSEDKRVKLEVIRSPGQIKELIFLPTVTFDE